MFESQLPPPLRAPECRTLIEQAGMIVMIFFYFELQCKLENEVLHECIKLLLRIFPSTASERAAPPTSSPIRRGKRSLAGATPRL